MGQFFFFFFLIEIVGCCCLVVQCCPTLFATPWTAARQASLSSTISWSLLKLCPLNQWCHPPISTSVVPFSSCLRSFPASESFPMSWLFASGGQSIGASASASILSMNIQGWFPLGLSDLIILEYGKSFQVLVSHHLFLIFLFLVCAEECVLGIVSLLTSLGKI